MEHALSVPQRGARQGGARDAPARRSRRGQLLVELETVMTLRPSGPDARARGARARPCAASSTREIAPHAAAWDEAEEFPRELYRQGRRSGPARRRIPRGVRRYAGRSPHACRSCRRKSRSQVSGGVHGEPLLPPDRLAAGRQRRQRGAEGAGASRGARQREDQRARDHRAGRGIGRRAPEDEREARGRRVRRRRREDVHHLGRARRLLHGRGAHRRAGRGRRLAAPCGAQPPRFPAYPAEEDGLVVLGHGDAAVRRRAACLQRT